MMHLTNMLSVCSATPSCSSHSLIPFHVGTRSLSSLRRTTEERHFVEDRAFFGKVDGCHTQEVSFRTLVAKCLKSPVVERSEQGGSLDSSISSPFWNEFDDTMRGFSNECFDREPENWSFSVREINGSYSIGDGMKYSESSKISAPEKLLLSNDFGGSIANELNSSIMAEPITLSNTVQLPDSLSGDELLNLHDSISQTSNIQSESAYAESILVSNSTTGIISDNTKTVTGTFEATEGFSKLKENIEYFLSGMNKSLDTSIDKLESAATDTYNAITVSVADSVKSVTESFDNTMSSLFFSTDNAKEQAGTTVTGFSVKFSDSIYRASTRSIDILRQAIVVLEDSLANATTVVVYSYESAKLLLPPEVRNVLNISEGKAVEILRPIGTGFQKVYFVIEQFERNLGFDPSDPVVPFIFFLGSSATIGVSYWVLTYGGYSGDLSPELTLELLKNEENAVLVDVRPEDLRERDGVPDLRRGARFKYASVTVPEIDGSTRKLLKSGREIDDALLAVVIRNLKIVRDESKIIVMDASGARSKGIARSLRKLGVKRPYLVQGGFRSWGKNGLRIKELKPETALTVLNEEAEAILEDIKPTPALVIGYGLGIFAAIYALIEWEKTLQLIGVIGLGQSLYQRVVSYEDSEDLKNDVRLLLAPVRLGAQAFTWAAGKLEPNRIGLPTSPSSTAVQDRVLQAAAKHESQPSDTEETQNPSRESTAQTSENLDLSEA